jgi:hypothetical protein
MVRSACWAVDSCVEELLGGSVDQVCGGGV